MALKPTEDPKSTKYGLADTKYGLAICCLIGPLLLGFWAPNRAADYLMPVGQKPVVNFVLPNLEAELKVKLEKARDDFAARQKATLDKQADVTQASAESDKKAARAALDVAKAAETNARAELEKIEKSQDLDRSVAQSTQIAASLTARYSYAAASGLLYLVSAATLLFAGVIVFRRWGMGVVLGGAVASGVLAAIIAWNWPTAYENAGYTFLRFLLDQVENDKNAFFKPLFAAYEKVFQVSIAVDRIVKFNTFVGMLAVGVALLAFATLSIRDEATPLLESLEERKTDLQTMLALSSAILVVATFASKVLLDWPISLMAPAQGEALKPLATALTTHLGITGTIALFAAAVPALVAWHNDVKRFRAAPASASSSKPAPDGLDFGFSSAMTSIIAILAPALTSPLFASFKSIIELFTGQRGGG